MSFLIGGFGVAICFALWDITVVLKSINANLEKIAKGRKRPEKSGIIKPETWHRSRPSVVAIRHVG